MHLLLSTILIFILELCRQCYWGFFQFIGVILKPTWDRRGFTTTCVISAYHK
jgi:hypothetical protein